MSLLDVERSFEPLFFSLACGHCEGRPPDGPWRVAGTLFVGWMENGRLQALHSNWVSPVFTPPRAHPQGCP